MKLYRNKLLLFISCLVLVGGCSVGTGSDVPANKNSASTKKGLLNNLTLSDNILPVNVWLWKASLDALNIMPINKIDSVAGIIITNWYKTEKGESFKVDIHIKGEYFVVDNLSVSVFRRLGLKEELDQVLSAQLKDVILLRARQLKRGYLEEKK